MASWRASRVKNYGTDLPEMTRTAGKSMTPLEALDKYMQINGVIAERSIRLQAYAEKVMAAVN